MLTNSPIVTSYIEKTGSSAALAAEAADLFPSSITHDSRYTDPHTIYVEKAEGSRKWDVDGNEYVDYFGGHGALLLGHRHPDVDKSVREALSSGTHFGSSHPLEVTWAKAIKRLLPSAERIRFTSSGTEATHMAIRLARAHTGRNIIVRFRTHFHGWHDHMAFGVSNHFDGTPSPGVLANVSEQIMLLDPGDIDAVAAALADNDDIAAVILEPTGGSWGMTPVAPKFVQDLRELTRQNDVLLIFDEVVTGFRVAPGGAQAWLEVSPDLTTLAKIVAGGLPGGAVVGAAEIFDRLDFKAAAEKDIEKIHHPGTFNANPVSAAAGATTLNIVAETDACDVASEFGANLRAGLNRLFADLGLAWAAYGTHSGFHLYMNASGNKIDPLDFDPLQLPYQELKAKPAAVLNKFRLALLISGVDIMGSGGGVISCRHDDADLQHTLEAFANAVEMLRAEETLPQL
jgi:glutamate-1-semialdehyde 2,1-aminomutase